MVIAYMRVEKLRQVDLKLLIIFAVIAEEKSTTKASARLLLSQPAEQAASWAPAHATGGRYGLGLRDVDGGNPQGQRAARGRRGLRRYRHALGEARGPDRSGVRQVGDDPQRGVIRG